MNLADHATCTYDYTTCNTSTPQRRPKMFSLYVASPTGVEAEFTLASAALALDLALRSDRAGFRWTAEHTLQGRSRRLSLPKLRQLAALHAETDEDRHLLDQIEWQHELQTSFALN
jgi:hypothetical protein